jgi:hypothetical protein
MALKMPLKVCFGEIGDINFRLSKRCGNFGLARKNFPLETGE